MSVVTYRVCDGCGKQIQGDMEVYRLAFEAIHAEVSVGKAEYHDRTCMAASIRKDQKEGKTAEFSPDYSPALNKVMHPNWMSGFSPDTQRHEDMKQGLTPGELENLAKGAKVEEVVERKPKK